MARSCAACPSCASTGLPSARLVLHCPAAPLGSMGQLWGKGLSVPKGPGADNRLSFSGAKEDGEKGYASESPSAQG